MIILLSCLHELCTSGFHQSEHPKSLCCSAIQQVHYYVLIRIYRLTMLWLLLSCIDENSRYFVLSSLKTKLFCKAQSDTVCRFDSNFSIQFCRFFNLQCWYNVVSSAYCKELQLMLSTMSTIYKLKSNGPNMLPCGTPKLLSWVDEVLSSICTYCHRSEI